MIGIIGAMAVEVAHLKEAMQAPQIDVVSGITFYRGRLAGQDVVLAKSGVGKVFAALCAQTMVLNYGVTRFVVSGVAGSLSKDLHIGDVVIATTCVQHDMDTSAVGDTIGMVSGINRIRFEADAATVRSLESVCRERHVPYTRGIVATGDQFVASAAKERWIADTFGAVASEMESCAVAQVAFVNRVPYAAIRVISDEADGKTPEDYPTFVAHSAQRSSEILIAWLKTLS
mgnify:FL=1